MRSRTRKRLGFLTFFVLILVTLSIAIWQYHQMIVGIYDGASASVYRRMLSPFQDPVGDGIGHRPIRVALLHSDATLATLGADARGLDDLVKQWEQFLAGQRIAFRRLSRLSGDGVLDDFNLLILPASAALRDTEIEAVKRFLRRGNGMIATWATGTRDEEGTWRRFSLLQQIAGIELMGPVPGASTERASVLLDARSPLASGVSPGFVLSLHRYDQPMYATVREDRARVSGAWTADARLEPRRLSLPPFRDDRAVIVHGDYLGGRFVWLGYTLSSTVETTEQREAAQRLLRNAIAWTSRQAIASRPHWPEDVRSAFSLTWRIARLSDMDERFLTLVSQYRIPVTSFVAPDLIEEDPRILHRLRAFGDVGLLIEPEGEDFVEPPPNQDRLRRLFRLLGEGGN